MGKRNNSRKSNSKSSRRIKSKKRQNNKSLKPIRQRLQSYVDLANQRVEEIAASGRYSPALEKAQSSQLARYRETEYNLFDISDKKRYTDIVREAGRLMEFLRAETSTISGIDRFEQSIQSPTKGNIGGQWQTIAGKSYNPSSIDSKTLSIAGSVYRRLEERYARLFVGATQYGSENLISELYDFISQSSEWIGENAIVESALNEFSIRLENFEVDRQRTAELLKDDNDFGFLEGFSEARNAAILRKYYW